MCLQMLITILGSCVGIAQGTPRNRPPQQQFAQTTGGMCGLARSVPKSWYIHIRTVETDELRIAVNGAATVREPV